MGNLEERVILLEGKSQSTDRALAGVRSEVGELRNELRATGAELRADIGQIRSEIGQIRSEIGQMRGEMATRTEISDLRREMGELRSDVNHRIDLLDAKFDRRFMWLTGIMMSGFITMIGAIVAVFFQLNSIR